MWYPATPGNLNHWANNYKGHSLSDQEIFRQLSSTASLYWLTTFMLKIPSKLVYSVNITFLQRFSTFWLRFKVFKLYRHCDKLKHHFQTLIESLIFVWELWHLICRLIKPWGIQICYSFKYTVNNSTCVGICKLTFYLFWPIFERQIIPRNLVHDEKLFLFSRSHRGFVNITEEIRTPVTLCVFFR